MSLAAHITRTAGGHFVYGTGGHMVYKAKTAITGTIWDKIVAVESSPPKAAADCPPYPEKADSWPGALAALQDESTAWALGGTFETISYWERVRKTITTYVSRTTLKAGACCFDVSNYTGQILKKITLNPSTLWARDPALAFYASVHSDSSTSPNVAYSWITGGVAVEVTGTGSTVFDLGSGVTLDTVLWVSLWIDGDFEPPDLRSDGYYQMRRLLQVSSSIVVELADA